MLLESFVFVAGFTDAKLDAERSGLPSEVADIFQTVKPAYAEESSALLVVPIHFKLGASKCI